MACVLAHPDPDRGYIGLTENEAHYASLLDALVDSGAWIPLPRDLARWWRARCGGISGADRERRGHLVRYGRSGSVLVRSVILPPSP